jgi:hypothetical protein
MEFYDAKISSIDGNYEMNVNLTKVDKTELLSINNPDYKGLIEQYQHLESVKMDDDDTKPQLPIHLVLGNGEYARIKTSTKPLVGNDCEPIAEKTKLGWFIMSPGVEVDKNIMLLTQTSQADFENLCRLNVLGLADSSENDQDADETYDDFKENISRQPATNDNGEETTFAKQQLGTNPESETKLLGLSWDKSQDTLSVTTNKEEPASTKSALSQLAKVYDPLGLVSPTTLPGKLLYREMCEENLAWDGEFPETLMKRWKEWYEQFPERYTVPRTLAPNQQPILSVSLHAFGDASKMESLRPCTL